MTLKIGKLSGFLFVSMLFLLTNNAWAQRDRVPKRVKVPGVIKHLVGGEKIDNYVFRARKGQRLIISFSWIKEEDNTANFDVSRSARVFRPFGRFSNHKKNWRGVAPKTGDYYIDVTAQPSARYTLWLR
jgi:hypothetical protein